MLIATHDALATAAALLASLYLRFEGSDAFFDRVPLCWAFCRTSSSSAWHLLLFKLTTTKWRFISLPDALNIVRVASVLTVTLIVLDYTFIFVAPNFSGPVLC